VSCLILTFLHYKGGHGGGRRIGQVRLTAGLWEFRHRRRGGNRKRHGKETSGRGLSFHWFAREGGRRKRTNHTGVEAGGQDFLSRGV